MLFFFWGAPNPQGWNQNTKWFVMNPSTQSLQPHHWTLVVAVFFTSPGIKAVNRTDKSICYISVPKCNASPEAGVDPGRVVWAAQPFPWPSSDPRDFSCSFFCCLHPQPPLDPLWASPFKRSCIKGRPPNACMVDATKGAWSTQINTQNKHYSAVMICNTIMIMVINCHIYTFFFLFLFSAHYVVRHTFRDWTKFGANRNP